MATKVRPIEVLEIDVIGMRRADSGSENLPNPGIRFNILEITMINGSPLIQRRSYTISITPLDIAKEDICGLPEDKKTKIELFDGEPDGLPHTDDKVLVLVDPLDPSRHITILKIWLSASNMRRVQKLLERLGLIEPQPAGSDSAADPDLALSPA